MASEPQPARNRVPEGYIVVNYVNEAGQLPFSDFEGNSR